MMTENGDDVAADDEEMQLPRQNIDEKSKTTTSPAPPSLKKLMSLGKPEFCMLLVAFVLMVFAEGIHLFVPLLIAEAYDILVDPELSQSERMSDISQVMFFALVIHFLSVIAGFLRGSIMAVAGERIVARLRNRLYASMLKQEIAFFDECKTGELVSRLGSDTTLIQLAISLAVPEVILGVVKLVVSVVLMFWISPQLAGVTIGTVSVLFVVCIPMGRVLGRLSKSYQDALGEAQTCSTEALGGMRTVQAFSAEARERKRYRDKVGDPDVYRRWWPTDHKVHKTTYSVGFFKGVVNTGFFTFIFGFGFGAMYVSLWYGFKLVNDDTMSLGLLTAFQSYIFQIGAGLAVSSRFLAQVIEARGASTRIFDLLHRVPAIPSSFSSQGPSSSSSSTQQGAGSRHLHNGSAPPHTVLLQQQPPPSAMNGMIEFQDVSFEYPSRPDAPVLRNFSLVIPANTTTALVGLSGSGKSTVVSLVQRFYEVSSGSIQIDGRDIRSLDLQWLRRHIGFVQQEPQLFGMTVRENVCYGMDRAVTEEEIIKVCRDANAHDFIMKWPLQYETMVGERGVKMSGGQKQRLAVARALLVNPRILLLDEATSALDAESEHLVQEAIDKAVVGRTVLIVAHRLSTIKNARQIVVMDEHRIEDVGTHEVLLERCTKYKDLIKRQSVIRGGPPEGSHRFGDQTDVADEMTSSSDVLRGNDGVLENGEAPQGRIETGKLNLLQSSNPLQALLEAIDDTPESRDPLPGYIYANEAQSDSSGLLQEQNVAATEVNSQSSCLVLRDHATAIEVSSQSSGRVLRDHVDAIEVNSQRSGLVLLRDHADAIEVHSQSSGLLPDHHIDAISIHSQSSLRDQNDAISVHSQGSGSIRDHVDAISIHSQSSGLLLRDPIGGPEDDVESSGLLRDPIDGLDEDDEGSIYGRLT